MSALNQKQCALTPAWVNSISPCRSEFEVIERCPIIAVRGSLHANRISRLEGDSVNDMPCRVVPVRTPRWKLRIRIPGSFCAYWPAIDIERKLRHASLQVEILDCYIEASRSAVVYPLRCATGFGRNV